MLRLNAADWVALALAGVGALNWGLVGLLGFNLVNTLLGSIPLLENTVYVLVGVAGLWIGSILVRTGQIQARQTARA